MDFDFSSKISRIGTHSVKYDAGWPGGLSSGAEKERLSFSIADMDFAVAPPIREAVRRVAEHGIYGYSSWRSEAYLDAMRDWYKARHNWTIHSEEIVATPGIVSGLLCLIRALTAEGDGIVIQPPVYPPFINLVLQEKRQLLRNPLRRDGMYYTIDFDDLERKLARPECRMMILCSPHNPVGRVWTAEELGRIVQLCAEHGVRLVSDEIHCDLTRIGGPSHTALRCLPGGEDAIICISMSKTFNLAGLALATLLIPDEASRQAVQAAASFSAASSFAVEAGIAAYRESGAWYEALRVQLDRNLCEIGAFLRSEAPQAGYRIPEGSYLAWLDLSAYIRDSEAFARRLVDEENIWLQEGTAFGAAPGFLRMNAACPITSLREGLERLASALKRHEGRL